jgi:chromate transporter
MLTLLQLAWVFLKIGTLCFGGGMVIVPLVENEVVLKYGWLTQREFIDAITLGQITPGPVVISATFIGYRVAGFMGALVSTLCVIMPSFTMVCLATEGIKKFKENKTLQNFFQGARAAIIGMIFEVGLYIGKSSIVNFKTGMIAAVALICLLKYKLNPMWVLLGAGVIGIIS